MTTFPNIWEELEQERIHLGYVNTLIGGGVHKDRFYVIWFKNAVSSKLK